MGLEIPRTIKPLTALRVNREGTESGFDPLVMQLGESMESCEITVGVSGFGKWTESILCGKPVKYVASYKGIRGETITEQLCGTHFRALEKKIAGLEKRTGYDAQLVAEKIA